MSSSEMVASQSLSNPAQTPASESVEPSEERATGGWIGSMPPAADADADSRAFYKTMEQNGQVAAINGPEDAANAPPHIRLLRYPDGSYERIRF